MKRILKYCTVVGLISAATFARAESAWVRFSEDSQRIIVDAQASDIESFVSAPSVVCKQDEKWHRIAARNHKILKPLTETAGTTPFGPAVVSQVTYGNDQFQYTLTMKRLEYKRAFTLQAVFHNTSGEDATFHTADLIDLQQNSGGAIVVDDPADWLVTPLMEATEAKPLNGEFKKAMNEVAIIYNQAGKGLLVGPVGPAEAHVLVEVKNSAIKAYSNMEGVLVRSGESRRSEEIIVSFEPADESIDMWTRWVAETHGVHRDNGPVYGWCSWYDRTTKIDEAHVLDVTKAMNDNPNTFGKGVIQIDDGYQKMDGDWRGNDKFPNGMASTAKAIREAGYVPGVWFAPLMIHPDHPWIEQNPDAIQTNAKGIASFMNPNPFHPGGAKWVNPDHPETKKFLFNIIRDARERGFGYIKIDFNGIGRRFIDPTKTSLQVFRDLYTLYREAAGEDMYILSCLGQPTRGVIGFIDAARVGPDSHPNGFAHCLESVLRFQIYHNVWWQNDPDVTYLNYKLDSRTLGATNKGVGMWKTWHGINALVGGTAMVSEPLNKDDARALWRNYEIMRPSSIEPAKLLTLGKSAHNTVFGFSTERSYGDFAVYNLYNDAKGDNELTLDFSEAGLPTGVECAVYDFWSDTVIDYVTDSYTTKALPQYSSELLRFTPLEGEDPLLLGSNLHLSIGATEVADIAVRGSTLKVKLTDAGAQDGTLTFYSEQPLVAAGAKNCTIDAVEVLGNNLWKVHLSGRLWNTDQSFKLKLQ